MKKSKIVKMPMNPIPMVKADLRASLSFIRKNNANTNKITGNNTKGLKLNK
jgi:hypothetical protein